MFVPSDWPCLESVSWSLISDGRIHRILLSFQMSALVKQQHPLLYASVPFECPNELLSTYRETVKDAVASARSS